MHNRTTLLRNETSLMSGKPADLLEQRNRSEHPESQLNPLTEVALAADLAAER